MEAQTEHSKRRKQSVIWYIIAGIGFIPLIGIPFGITGTIRGVLTRKKYGNKLLIVSAFSFIPMTIAYTSLFILTQQKDGIFADLGASLNANLVSDAVSEIEMHKMSKGSYPEGLGEIKNKNSLLFITDSSGNMRAGFYYETKDDGYIIGNVGRDSLAKTDDDIVPVLNDTTDLGIRNAKIGKLN